MTVTQQASWATEMAATISALPNEWDDRRGAEFDRLSSDERVAIHRNRRDPLSAVGRLLIKAILDHRWRIHPLALVLDDRAAGARQSEQTKPYEQGAIVFLGMFVEWYREHPELLPPNAPALAPLNSHLTGFQPGDVSEEDFAKTCEAIAWVLTTTKPPSGKVLTDPIPLVSIVEVVGRKAGRSDKLAGKMKCRNYPVEKLAGKYHCQRADAIAMFPHYRQRIEEI